MERKQMTDLSMVPQGADPITVLLRQILAGQMNPPANTVNAAATGGVKVAPIQQAPAVPASAAINAAPQLTRPVIGQGPAIAAHATAPQTTASATPIVPHPAVIAANQNTPPPLSSDVASLISLPPEYQSILNAEDKTGGQLRDQIMAESQERQKIYQRMEDLKPPVIPALNGTTTPPPGLPEVQPIKAFSNWGVALALLGSLLTRRPLTAALKVGASAMNAYNSGQWRDYQVRHQIWKDAVDTAMRQNQLEIDKYNMAWNQHVGDMDTLTRELEGIAQQNKDEVMLYNLKMGMYDKAFELLQHREDMQQRAALQREMAGIRAGAPGKSLGAQLLEDFRAEYQAAHGHPPSAEEEGAFLKANLPMGGSASANAAAAATGDMFDTADMLLSRLDSEVAQHPSSVGAVGKVVGPVQALSAWFSGNPVAQQQFEGDVELLKTTVSKLMKSRNLTQLDNERYADIVRGLGLYDNPATVRDSYRKLKAFLNDLRGRGHRYGSPQEVKNAVANGEITGDEGVSILVNDFGFAP
jgi:hypothetical protein